ncbi:MAG: hypothetical protein JWN12_624 [Candidatus Saccharibacteria bacterium]|nr:hypothetical protein [Candidatus Saccharibacteria bacterium]
MAENHYVDSKDQHEAAQGVEDHSELTVFYAKAKEEDLGPWMQEDDRQAAMEKERNNVIAGLRKSSILVGLCMSLPVVLGLLLGQLALIRDTFNQTDAMILAFLLLFLLAGLLGITYALFRWIGKTFHKHTVRALPITLTTLLSLFFLIMPLFRITGTYIGGVIGYSIALGVLVVIGILITLTSIFTWTAARIHPLAKILILVLIFGVSVAVAYLA